MTAALLLLLAPSASAADCEAFDGTSLTIDGDRATSTLAAHEILFQSPQLLSLGAKGFDALLWDDVLLADVTSTTGDPLHALDVTLWNPNGGVVVKVWSASGALLHQAAHAPMGKQPWSFTVDIEGVNAGYVKLGLEGGNGAALGPLCVH